MGRSDHRISAAVGAGVGRFMGAGVFRPDVLEHLDACLDIAQAAKRLVDSGSMVQAPFDDGSFRHSALAEDYRS